MVWNGVSPRAFYPTGDLLSARTPVRGSALAAARTALPRALGVYVLREDGRTVPQALTYLPPAAADARGGGVRAGWYLAAEPGARFEVRVTATRGHDRLHGYTLRGPEGVRFDVTVDGQRANHGYIMKRDAPRGSEIVVPGFTRRVEFAPGEELGEDVFTAFRFGAAPVAEGGAPAPRGAGSIACKFWVGKLNFTGRSYAAGDPETTTLEIRDEKSAIKRGDSITVERTGQKRKAYVLRAISVMDAKERRPVGEVNIFLREKGWLVRNRIINEAGHPWKEENVLIKLEDVVNWHDLGEATDRREPPAGKELEKLKDSAGEEKNDTGDARPGKRRKFEEKNPPKRGIFEMIDLTGDSD